MKNMLLFCCLAAFSSCIKLNPKPEYTSIRFTVNNVKYDYSKSAWYRFSLNIGSDDITTINGENYTGSGDFIWITQHSNWGASYTPSITVVLNGKFYKTYGDDQNGNSVFSKATLEERTDTDNKDYTIGNFTATLYPVSGNTASGIDTITGPAIELENGYFRLK